MFMFELLRWSLCGQGQSHGRPSRPNNEQGNRRVSRKTRPQQLKSNSSSDEDSDIPMDPELSGGIGDDNYDSEIDLRRAPTPPEQAEVPQILGSTTPNRRRSKRVCTDKSFGVDQEDCAETDCNDPLSQEEKIRCARPGCNAKVHAFFLVLAQNLTVEDSQYHLSCVGLDAVPTGGWFCDADCRTNAGQRIAPARKRRRIVFAD